MKSINRPPAQRASHPSRARLDPDALAAGALAFMAADLERLQRFMTLTGTDPTTLRSAAREPGFTRSILSYVASDEEFLVAFAAGDGLDPEDVGRVARHQAEAAWDGTEP